MKNKELKVEIGIPIPSRSRVSSDPFNSLAKRVVSSLKLVGESIEIEVAEEKLNSFRVYLRRAANSERKFLKTQVTGIDLVRVWLAEKW